MAPKRDTGLLSNVFVFFKSEIGAFVSNATGGTTDLDDEEVSFVATMSPTLHFTSFYGMSGL